MIITLDLEHKTILTLDQEGNDITLPIYSREGFSLLSKIWIKQEWNQLHWQSFSWLGCQVWQLPEDLIRLQEILVTIRPDVIIETGVNQGGSAIFFASLCRLMGKGRVISIDISITQSVKSKVLASGLTDLITWVEGDSASTFVVDKVKGLICPDEKVFIFLDSDHSKSHVLNELNAYAELVTPGSYIVATDGVMESLSDTPHGHSEWALDNPAAAARDFVKTHPEFEIKRPTALYGQQYVIDELTYWPDAWLFRIPDRK